MFNCIDGMYCPIIGQSSHWRSRPILLTTRMITDQIGLDSVLLALQIIIAIKSIVQSHLFLPTPLQYRHFSIMDISLGSSNANFIHLRLLYNTAPL